MITCSLFTSNHRSAIPWNGTQPIQRFPPSPLSRHPTATSTSTMSSSNAFFLRRNVTGNSSARSSRMLVLAPTSPVRLKPPSKPQPGLVAPMLRPSTRDSSARMKNTDSTSNLPSFHKPRLNLMSQNLSQQALDGPIPTSCSGPVSKILLRHYFAYLRNSVALYVSPQSHPLLFNPLCATALLQFYQSFHLELGWSKISALKYSLDPNIPQYTPIYPKLATSPARSNLGTP